MKLELTHHQKCCLSLIEVVFGKDSLEYKTLMKYMEEQDKFLAKATKEQRQALNDAHFYIKDINKNLFKFDIMCVFYDFTHPTEEELLASMNIKSHSQKIIETLPCFFISENIINTLSNLWNYPKDILKELYTECIEELREDGYIDFNLNTFEDKESIEIQSIKNPYKNVAEV